MDMAVHAAASVQRDNYKPQLTTGQLTTGTTGQLDIASTVVRRRARPDSALRRRDAEGGSEVTVGLPHQSDTSSRLDRSASRPYPRCYIPRWGPCLIHRLLS